MTPKEKAISLIEAFTPLVRWKMRQEDYRKRAVGCALIAVEELIRVSLWCGDDSDDSDEDSKEYWQQIKQEIENYENINTGIN